MSKESPILHKSNCVSWFTTHARLVSRIGLSFGYFIILGAMVMVTGCAIIRTTSDINTEIKTLHSDNFTDRQKATEKLMSRAPEDFRQIVIPELISISAKEHMELTTKDSSIYQGRLIGGNEAIFIFELGRNELSGAVIEIATANIMVIRF